MNRRKLLSFLGLAPVAAATGAVAAQTPNDIRELNRLSAIDANAGEVTVWGGGGGAWKFKTVRVPFLTSLRGDTTRVIETETANGWNFISFVPCASNDHELLFRRWEAAS